MLIREMPEGERPRERLASKGPDALSKEELLAVLLRTGTKGRSVLLVASDLLKTFGNLHDLARATIDELQSVPGVGRDKAVTLAAAFGLFKKLSEERFEDTVMQQPEQVAAYMRDEVRDKSVETFYILMLNTRRRLIKRHVVSQGILDTILVHPREVFRPAIAANASAIILVHNHPSGDPTPSEQDIMVTHDLVRAGKILRVQVLDHIIMGAVGGNRTRDYCSLRELGHING
jgi:DNA repair protein RadC